MQRFYFTYATTTQQYIATQFKQSTVHIIFYYPQAVQLVIVYITFPKNICKMKSNDTSNVIHTLCHYYETLYLNSVLWLKIYVIFDI